MIDSIHQSTLGMFDRCAEQFRRRYIEGEIILPSIEAARGTGVHGANNINLAQKIDSHVDLESSDLEDEAATRYKDTIKDGVYLSKEKAPEVKKLAGMGLDDTVRCTKLYRKKVSPDIQPKLTEETFKIDIGVGIPLVGTIDYATVVDKIGDLKSTKMKWPKGRAEAEIQPVMYSLGYEMKYQKKASWTYNILIARRNKDGEITSEEHQPIPLDIGTNHYQALVERIKVMLRALEAGIFPPAPPTTWWCDPNWCGFYYTCKYVGNAAGVWV